MKRFINRLVKRFSKPLTALAIVAGAVVLQVSTVMAAAVNIEGALGVANVTAGHTNYQTSVDANYDDVIKFQVFYHNRENENSGKIAEDLRVKINIPTTPGKKQTISAKISGANTNTVNDSVTVNLDRADAYLEFIPGSVVWRHNKGTNSNVNIVEEVISNTVVTGTNGKVIEDAKPCYNFSASVTALARVRVPGVEVKKQVRVKGSSVWSTRNTAKPGDTLQYMISYKNIGNTVHEDVVIRDNLPPGMTYVPGSTQLKNSNGTRKVADGIVKGGLEVGDYNPGANAHILFEVKVEGSDKLKCGVTEYRNVGIARPEGMNEFYNTAITKVEKVCKDTPETPEKPEKPVKPATMPKTGAGSILGIFASTTAGGALAHKIVLSRRKF